MRFLRRASSFLNNLKSSNSDGGNLINSIGGVLSKISLVHIGLAAAPIIVIVIAFLTIFSLFNYKVNLMQMVDTKTNKTGSSSSPTGTHQAIVDTAMQYLGEPYCDTGSVADPGGCGFNCSGLAWWAYEKAGFTIPHAQGYYSYYTGYTNGENSQMWWVESKGHWKNSTSECSPGDLVFYSPVHDKYQTGHVAIYMGNDQIVEANYGGVQVSDATTENFVGCGWPLD